ncbi:hypothetical protein [Lysinibacillus capsici]|uniref:hypothetical protein n=1 Tax=Lysinibacillus capsici TaxID=2115968 RepID=UPI000E200B29|nr:hypothetical protein [Lysinibacillus capsici]RDV27115.1 hypothetical protein C7B89_19960 [Lysinibacillus capsici]
MTIILNNTGNPINRTERIKINENWDRIIAGLTEMQYQINMLAGGEDVQKLLEAIHKALDNIAEAQRKTDELIVIINKAADNADAKAKEAETATQNANIASQKALEAVNNVTVALADLDLVKQATMTATQNANDATVSATQASVEAKDAAKFSLEETEKAIKNINDTISASLADMTVKVDTSLQNVQVAIEASNKATTDNTQATFNAITEAETKVNTAVQNADNATERANIAAEGAEQATEAIKGWGTATVWSADTAYERNNVVTENGSTWQATKANTNSKPSLTNTDWIMLAQRGIDGDGSVSTVNGQSPDIDGNVQLTAFYVGADTSQQVTDKVNALRTQLKDAGYDTESLTTVTETELVSKTTSGTFYITPESNTFLPLDKDYVGDLSVKVAANIETKIYSLTDLETAKTYTRVVVTDTDSDTVSSDTQWIEGGGGGGSIRTEVHAYTLETTIESQKTWNIPDSAFDINSDSMMVFHNTVYLTPTSWNVTGDSSSAKLNIPDNPEIAIAENNVYIVVFKNLPTDENTAISGTLLTPSSVSMSKLGQDVKEAIAAAGDTLVRFIAPVLPSAQAGSYQLGINCFVASLQTQLVQDWLTSVGLPYDALQNPRIFVETTVIAEEGNSSDQVTQTLKVYLGTIKAYVFTRRGARSAWYSWTKIGVDIVDDYTTGGNTKVASAEAVKNLHKLLQYHGVATENIQHITDVEMLNSKISGCFVVAVTGIPSTIMPVGLGIFIVYIAQHIDSNGNALRSFICSHAASGNMYSRNVRMQSIEDDTILQDSGWVKLFTRIADNLTTDDPLQVLSASAGKRLSDYVNENINYLRTRMSLFNIERRQPDTNGKYVEIMYRDPNNVNNVINSLLAKSAPTVQHYDRLTWNGEINGVVVDYTWRLQYDSKNTVVEKATLVL